MKKGGPIKNRTGLRFNRLVFETFAFIKNGRAFWLCLCDCGKRKAVHGSEVVSGKIKSCGCWKIEVCTDRITSWSKQPYEKKNLNGRQRRDGYSYVRRPDHPSVSKEGYVAAHRLAAEEKIGRLLKEKEIVHHWDEDSKNNEHENLCVMRSNSPHFRLHLFAKRHGIEINQLKFEQPWLLS